MMLLEETGQVKVTVLLATGTATSKRIINWWINNIVNVVDLQMNYTTLYDAVHLFSWYVWWNALCAFIEIEKNSVNNKNISRLK